MAEIMTIRQQLTVTNETPIFIFDSLKADADLTELREKGWSIKHLETFQQNTNMGMENYRIVTLERLSDK